MPRSEMLWAFLLSDIVLFAPFRTIALNTSVTKFCDSLPVDYVRSRLSYNPETGALIWRNGRNAGLPAGGRDDRRYTRVRLKGDLYYVHRVMYALMTGEWPKKQIDHADRDPTNHKWSNLRLATHGQNQTNAEVPRNNTSGQTGVHQRKDNGKWDARISYQGRRLQLGSYRTKAEAIAARNVAEMFAYGEFSPRTRRLNISNKYRFIQWLS